MLAGGDKIMKKSKKLMSFILSMVLVVAMALCTTGCGDSKEQNQSNQTSGVQETQEQGTSKTVLGKGSTKFDFNVVDTEGRETAFEIHTDKDNVGAALVELNLIAGDDSAYGLYVKTVNGTTLDFDKDKMYWAFYVNGEYATTGVDTTPVKSGDVYSFKASK